MRRLADQSDSERGSVLIEVMVSALLLTVTAVGVFSAFDAGTRSTAEQRHRAQAEGLAQTDLARLRTMRVSALSNLEQTKVVTIEETSYTVESAAEFQTDSTGTASCDSGNASADYIQIRSTVTWPSMGERPPVVAQSLVAPPNGSISTKSGSLAVQIVNAKVEGIEGVGISGTGPKAFSGLTGSNGCAIFGNLPAGEYTLTLSGPTLYDDEGEAPQPEIASVVAESTNTLVLQYDQPGDIEASFQTRVGGVLVPSSADAVTVYNGSMDVAKVFGTPGAAQTKVTATPLFPFASPYAVYAGTCEGNDPGQTGISPPEGVVINAVVSANGTTPVTLELPALHMQVLSGEGVGDPKNAPVAGATVEVTDTKCEEEKPVVHTYTTNAEGALPDPGLPYSTYDICVSDGTKHVDVGGVDVPFHPEEMQVGTSVAVYLGEPGAAEGACP